MDTARSAKAPQCPRVYLFTSRWNHMQKLSSEESRQISVDPGITRCGHSKGTTETHCSIRKKLLSVQIYRRISVQNHGKNHLMFLTEHILAFVCDIFPFMCSHL